MIVTKSELAGSTHPRGESCNIGTLSKKAAAEGSCDEGGKAMNGARRKWGGGRKDGSMKRWPHLKVDVAKIDACTKVKCESGHFGRTRPKEPIERQ
jgi:hypothetical protein